MSTKQKSGNTAIVLLVIAAILAAVYITQSGMLKQPSQPVEVVSDDIQDPTELTQASKEMDAINIDGAIDPELTQVNADAQSMR